MLVGEAALAEGVACGELAQQSVGSQNLESSALGGQVLDLKEAFCSPTDPEICIPNKETGKLEPLEGLFCCWGTSCENTQE